MAARSRRSNKLDDFIEAAVIHGQLASGRSPQWVAAKSPSPGTVAVLSKGERPKSGRAAEWLEDDDNFLRVNLGWLSEEEIAQHLGRTVIAVHLRWKRDLKLTAPSKHPDYITTQKIAETLGVDPKAAMRWVDMSLLPGRRLPFNGRTVRSVSRVTFLRWTLNPMNWIYFRPERVTDLHLRRLLRLKQKRWGDEWLTPGEVARLHHTTHAVVNNKLHSRELQGVKWGNWHILRSEATKPSLRIYSGKGSACREWSEAGDAFIILARAVGLSTNAIGQMMGGWPGSRVFYRLKELRRRGRMPSLIRKYNLKVLYRPTTGALLADWKDYRQQFKRLAQTMECFADGQALRDAQEISLVRGVLHVWAEWHAQALSQREFARRLMTAGQSHTATLQRALHELRSWGANPMNKLKPSHHRR